MNTKLFILPNLLVFFRLLFILLGPVPLISSCASVQVSQDFDTNYIFSTLQTFDWNENTPYQKEDLLNNDELLAKRFREAIKEALTKRKFIQNVHADFLISCTYSITSRLQVDPVDSHFGFGYGRFGRYGGVGLSTGSSIRQYDQGMLVINIHSAKTGQLLWKGTGTQEVFIHSTPAQITRSVKEIVEAVLAQFPPLSP